MSIELDIAKSWGSFRLDVQLQQKRGILGLLGASGCGKSKTLQCIAGIERPERGKIVLNGRLLFSSREKINCKIQSRRVGYLFQHYALFPQMTVAENLACGARRKPKPERCRCVQEMLGRLHLTGLEKRKPAALSGGQQQRVALGRILLNEPDILLLDEPFSALDSFLKEKVMRELQQLLRQFPKDVIFVTHDRDEAYQFCDQLAIMDQGRISVMGPTRAIFAQPQTKVAAVLTGCKNIVEARKAGPGSVFVPDWQRTLRVPGTVPADLTALGIRAPAFRPDIGENSFPVQIIEKIEQPFTWLVKFRYLGQRSGTPALYWRLAKTSSQALPTRLGVRGQDLLLLTR